MFATILLACLSLSFITGCRTGKQQTSVYSVFDHQKNMSPAEQPDHLDAIHQQAAPVHAPEEELDFTVYNATNQTIHVVCFSYIKKQDFTRWRWDKSEIYTLENNQSAYIDVDTIPDPIERTSVYGYLAVFSDRDQAERSTYELLDDRYKIDLDLLYKLKDKTLTVGVEQYGIHGKIMDYQLKEQRIDTSPTHELDFVVENKTGEPLWVAAFVYQHRGSPSTWRFDKVPPVLISAGQEASIDVDSLVHAHDYHNLRGYLGVFHGEDEDMALQSTYELLAPENKVRLGSLEYLRHKKVTLEAERYGLIGDTIDYTIHPVRKIEFGTTSKRDTHENRLKAWR